VIRRRDNGRWEMPGGILELDETPEDGVRREVREETGLIVDVRRLTGVYKNVDRGIVALVFRCDPAGGSTHPTDEATEVRWVTLDQVVDRMYPADAIRVLDAFTPQPPVRSHDGVDLR
jgi:8-oxo-dGTP diphosphatase